MSILRIASQKNLTEQIIAKKRIAVKVIKKYDTAKTPCCRLMASSDISEAVKAELCAGRIVLIYNNGLKQRNACSVNLSLWFSLGHRALRLGFYMSSGLSFG